MFLISTQKMKENINYFSLADLKRHMGLDDGLNENVFIHDFKVDKNSPEVPHVPGRADAIGITICHEGEISITINARNFVLQPGSAAMILPNCIYDVSLCTLPARGTIFAVSASLLRDMHIDIQQMIPLGMHMFHNPCFHLTEKSLELYDRYLDMVRMVSKRDAGYGLPVLQGILASMMAFTHDAMAREVGDAAKEPKSEHGNHRNIRLFEEFMRLLTENFRTEHQIGFYADKLCLTPKYLSLLIKQTSGRSVSDWIDYCIIMEAKSLLRFSDMSIQQVSYTLNFPTPSFFGTYFKRHTGVTPGEFRQGSEDR